MGYTVNTLDLLQHTDHHSFWPTLYIGMYALVQKMYEAWLVIVYPSFAVR